MERAVGLVVRYWWTKDGRIAGSRVHAFRTVGVFAATLCGQRIEASRRFWHVLKQPPADVPVSTVECRSCQVYLARWLGSRP